MPAKTVTKQSSNRAVSKPEGASRFYPGDDSIKRHVTRAKVTAKQIPFTRKPQKLRKSITAGTVLVILTGRFRGKRVVFLKQLKSGLLLVTGPYKINGVCLRRVNQRFVIATSTRVDITGVSIPEHIDDAYFKKPKTAHQPKTADSFFVADDATKTKTQRPDNKKADQKAVDAAIIASVKKVPLLSNYLATHFTLERHQFPHELKF